MVNLWRRSLKSFVLLVVFGSPTMAYGNWTLNVGYHNPAGSTVGLNLLYWGQHWAFEFGVGWLEFKSDDKDQDDKKDRAELNVGGDIDVKYLFGRGGLRPYLQAGVGYGAGAAFGDEGGAGVAAGGGFVGGGLMAGSPSFYGYAAYNVAQHDSFLQAGLGIDI